LPPVIAEEREAHGRVLPRFVIHALILAQPEKNEKHPAGFSARFLLKDFD
jgi:hypothetical protein